MNITHDPNRWNTFLMEIIKHGFEIITYHRYNNRNGDRLTNPSFVVAVHRQNKLILVANSIIWDVGDELVSSVKLYGCLTVPEELVILEGVTSSGRREDKMFFTIESKDALYRIDRVAEQGTFTSWQGTRLQPYLLDFEQQETLKAEPYASRRLWDEFLAAAPEWVREFIV